MTEQNYNETDPNKYLMQSGETIAQLSNEELKRAMTSDLTKMANYCNKEEINNLKSLFNDTYKENEFNLQAAIEFDKVSRFYAWRHWDNNNNDYSKEVLRKNINEWFEAAVKREQAKEQIKEDYITTRIMIENYEQIIHSKDFIEKFGDWEKAQRLKILTNDKSIEKKTSVLINEIDITNKIEIARRNNDSKTLREYADMIAINAKGTYPLKDLNNAPILVSGKTIKESKLHITDPYQVEALTFIPDILNNGRFISHEKNEDIITHPDINSYDYVICGLKINNEDFTAKSVIANDNNGNRYYDHQLSKIEKGKLLDVLNPLTSRDSLSNLPYTKDKRLLRVCQVSQRPYLDENLKPTQEAVQLVQEGKLYLEKDPVTGFTSMCNENECNHKILQFRNMFNTQQKAHEPKITYENAEDILTFCATASLNEYRFPKNMNGKIVMCFLDENNSIESEREYTPKELLNHQILTVDNRLYYASESDLSKPNYKMMLHMKNIAEQNTHAENCTKIIENWIDACGVLGESKDFKNVTQHAKNTFKQNIENAKNNLSKLDDTSPLRERKSAENLVSFNKDEFEYFKHNAKPLFDNAVEKILVRDEINKQKELSQKAELDVWIEKAEKDNKRIQELTETIQEQNQLLYGKSSVEINGKVRTVEHGLKNAFAKSVERLDIQNETIRELDSQIYKLSNSQTNNISAKSPSDDTHISY